RPFASTSTRIVNACAVGAPINQAYNNRLQNAAAARNFPRQRPNRGRAPVRTTIIRTGLETLYFSGAHLLMRPFFAGVGAILMLHHVRPGRADEFQPNQLLEVTPEFLEQTVSWLRQQEIDIISLDEMHRRLTQRDFGRRFACITLDDGYRDNKVFA